MNPAGHLAQPAAARPLPAGRWRRRRWSMARTAQVLLSANALWMYLFLYVPIALLVIFSFNNATHSLSVWQGFTLSWYEQLFRDAAVGQALRNSLIVALVSTVVSTIIGTLAALAMERYHFFGKVAFDALLYLPIIIPEIAMGVMLLLFFVLMGMDLGLPTIIISHVAFNISFVTVVVRARLAGLSTTLEEAAQDLGANGWQTFRRITLPLLMPGLFAGALLAFTISLDDYVITYFTAGPGATTLPIRIYGMVKKGISPDVNALSTLMLLAAMVLVVLSLVLQRGGDRKTT
jgi:spermidine/putrescine transport system permease protein